MERGDIHVPKRSFLDDQVLQAQYCSNYGYHCGPIPSVGIDWTGYDRRFLPNEHRIQIFHTLWKLSEQKRYKDRLLHKGDRDLINTDIEREYGEPNGRKTHPWKKTTPENTSYQPLMVSPINGEICWVSVSSTAICGAHFRYQKELDEHQKTAHECSVWRPYIEVDSESEEVRTGQKALMRYVLMGDWKRAVFHEEPRDVGGIIKLYCNSLEEIAAQDKEFARNFGTTFHRDSVHHERKRRKRQEEEEAARDEAARTLLSVSGSSA